MTVFTNYFSLLFRLHRAAVDALLGNHKVLNVTRWAIYLAAFSYNIEHVPAE